MQAEIPPFERFYVEHRDEVLGYLRRLLGQRAEDAWQETFLRALRAYDRLEHGAAPTRVGVHDRDARRDGRPARKNRPTSPSTTCRPP